jgi:sugar phosphate isomerase/epimerase
MPEKPEISFQLYSSRNFPPIEAQLSALSRIGFRNVEPFGGLYGDVDGLKAKLDAAQMKAPSGHFGLSELENDFAASVSIARKLGISLVVCPWINPDERPRDGAGWTAVGKRLGRIGRAVKAEGLRFAWHNHDFEFEPLPGGSLPIERVMDDPAVGIELDIAWLVRGRADPATWIRKLAGRIAACHVKDIAVQGQKIDEDGWADVGQGTIDWKTLWPMVVKAGARLMIAEHDRPRDFERFARTSLAAMKQYATS